MCPSDAFHSPQDQSKIRLAIGLRRVDSADIPASAKATEAVLATPGPSQKKRKLQYDLSSSQNTPPASSQPSSSQPSSSQPLRRISGPPLSQITQHVEEIEDDEPEPEAKDELYVMLRTSIVGIQYYKGAFYLDTESSCSNDVPRPCWGRRRSTSRPPTSERI